MCFEFEVVTGRKYICYFNWAHTVKDITDTFIKNDVAWLIDVDNDLTIQADKIVSIKEIDPA